MYGRKLRLPLDIVFSYNRNEDIYQNIQELKENFSKIYAMVRENMNRRQDTAASYYDRSVIDDKLELNCPVYVFNPRSGKFQLRWEGPYHVRKCRHPSYLVGGREWEAPRKMVHKR